MPVRDHREGLLTRLSDPAYASLYLKAALDETLQDNKMEAFLLALGNIVDATGAVQDVADQSQLSRQHLHKLLSGKGNPTLETLAAVLSSVGLTIDFKPTV